MYRLANFEGHLSDGMNTDEEGSGLNEYVMNQFDASLSWDDIKWLQRS